MKFLSLLMLCLILCPVALAQEHPKSELFGGYSLLRTESDSVDLTLDGQTVSAKRRGAFLNGFNVSVTYNPARWAGFIVDGGGNYGNIDYTATIPGLSATAGVRTNFHTLLLGPQFSRRGDRATFFVRALAGVAFVSQTLDLTGFGGLKTEADGKAFAGAAGAGFDIKLSDRVSLRAIQADYIFTRFGDPKFVINGQTLSGPDTQHSIRISTGFVFRNRD